MPEPIRFISKVCLCLVVPLYLSFTTASANETGKNIETIGDVSIIGNTELPNVTFNLPWRLPSVEKREEQSPPREISGMLEPIEPDRHNRLVHFSKYLEVEIPRFKAD